MLAGKGNSTRYIYNGLASEITISTVLLTDSVSSKKLLQRRIKKIGFLTVLNQLVFQLGISKLLAYTSRRILANRKQELGLIESSIPRDKIIEVGSVNSRKCKNLIQKLNPDVIIVNGTAIISKNILQCTNAIFINTHVGITPQYRGVHGGYWALRNQDVNNFGVTVHKVDTGIDTGDIIYQNTCTVQKEDNFLTYPLYQYALAIPLLKQTLEDIKGNKLKTFKKQGVQSKLYYHPTFIGYIIGRIKNGVK